MRIALLPQNGFIKFDSHLPIYNWMYPVAGQETVRLERDLIYGHIETDHVRGRALYFHVPFCESICSFCPFVRGLYEGDEIVEAYTKALITEIELKSQYSSVTCAPIGAIFFGGGTPSILSTDQIRRVGEAIRRAFDLSRLREFSFEIEVKSVTPEKLHAMREIGVTHARFGLQTFNERYRRDFTLTATLDQIYSAVELMKGIFPWVSFDILYGMHGQTIEEFADDVERAASQGTTNIDFYPINNLVAQTRLHQTFAAQNLAPVSAMTKLHMNVFLNEAMRSLGFLPHNGHGYVRASADEIARAPVVTDSYKFQYHEYAYGYYEDELIGFGNSAISQTARYSIRNLEDRESYIRSLLHDRSWKEKVVEHPVLYEKGIAFRLPYHGSVNKMRIQWDRVARETLETLTRFVEAGLIEETPSEYRLTRVGWYWYVNLMYLLSPEGDRRVLSAFIDKRLAEPARREGKFMSLPGRR